MGQALLHFPEEERVYRHPLKESCALAFFKGALLKDAKHILQKAGEHTQAGRWIKFTSLPEITPSSPP